MGVGLLAWQARSWGIEALTLAELVLSTAAVFVFKVTINTEVTVPQMSLKRRREKNTERTETRKKLKFISGAKWSLFTYLLICTGSKWRPRGALTLSFLVSPLFVVSGNENRAADRDVFMLFS